MVADANAVAALINTFPLGTAALAIANAICAVIAQTPASHRFRGRRGSMIVNGYAGPDCDAEWGNHPLCPYWHAPSRDDDAQAVALSLSELLCQFSTSPAFASMVIRRLSHSRFSHLDFILPGEGLLGVSGLGDYISGGGMQTHDPGGVMVRPFDAWVYLEPPKIARVQAPEATVRAIIEAGRSQIGKPFDNSALWGFLSDQVYEKKRNWRDTGQWYCSEFATWSQESGKLFPYPLIVTKDRVSPGDNLLMINPFMSHENIGEFGV